MGFFKCKKCNHVDTYSRFTSRAGRRDLPPMCPRCFNDEQNIVELGNEISCSGCIYNTLVAGSCSHPENKPGSDFWNRPQELCYTSKVVAYDHQFNQPVPSVPVCTAGAIAAFTGK
ncbi:MAG: hypothetical protein CSA26_03855 [Desulfobacterales bacterium]|nr:MAG: hypothetical protein CSA26_03855 [Desulfobacterales bacterium]